MTEREEYYSLVEGDDIDSIVLDRNILPLRKLPLARGEDICYLIQNIAARNLAVTGCYSSDDDFIKFSNKPNIELDGRSGGLPSVNQITSIL